MAVATYLDRKLAEPCVCTYPGCGQPPADGVQLCTRHRRRHNLANRRSASRLRKRRRARGRCAECSAKSSSYYCVRHAIAAGRVRPAAVGNAVGKRERIAARTRVDSSGRVRYGGQDRRGSQPVGQLEAKELDDAIALLVRTKAGLAMARAAPGLSKRERDAAIRAAVAHADQVSRMIEELCNRCGYQQQMLVADDDGDAPLTGCRAS